MEQRLFGVGEEDVYPFEQLDEVDEHPFVLSDDGDEYPFVHGPQVMDGAGYGTFFRDLGLVL